MEGWQRLRFELIKPSRLSLIKRGLWRTIEQAIKALDQDFTPITDHRASAWYRQQVAQNLLRGFWLEVSQGAPERLPYRPSSTLILSDTQDQGARS